MFNKKEYRKKYYWENRDRAIQESTRWNKENKDKRRVISKRDNKKRVVPKRIWREQKVFGGNATLLNKKCELCRSEYRLGIHHKDGNNGKRNKTMNNNPENLIVLCVRCHSSVHGWWGVKEV